jgi:hypothetical protein
MGGFVVAVGHQLAVVVLLRDLDRRVRSSEPVKTERVKKLISIVILYFPAAKIVVVFYVSRLLITYSGESLSV